MRHTRRQILFAGLLITTLSPSSGLFADRVKLIGTVDGDLDPAVVGFDDGVA